MPSNVPYVRVCEPRGRLSAVKYHGHVVHSEHVVAARARAPRMQWRLGLASSGPLYARITASGLVTKVKFCP